MGVWGGDTGEKRLGAGAHGQQDSHRAEGTTAAAGATNECWEWLKMTDRALHLQAQTGSLTWLSLSGRLSRTCIWQGLSPGEG